MIQKTSILKPSDNCGVLKVNVFQVYRGSKGKLAFVGDFLKVSVREIEPENTIKKKSKHRAFLIRTKFKNMRKDASFIKFFDNSLILLKKRLTPRGKILKGPVSINIRRKKFLSSFAKRI